MPVVDVKNIKGKKVTTIDLVENIFNHGFLRSIKFSGSIHLPLLKTILFFSI